MFKKLFILALVVVAGWFIVKKTNALSYAGTLWNQIRCETKRTVPTKFELDRARYEINNLDKDISNLLRPIAEHMAAVNRLKKDIQTGRASLAEQRSTMLALTKDLESNPKFVSVGEEEFSAERLRRKLQRDFDVFKRCETNLRTKEKLLEAKEQSLAANREQLAKLIAKKREYELRLEQLEAEEQTLQIARMGSKIKLDDSRATEIEQILSGIEQRHDVQRAELELANGPIANDLSPSHRDRSTADVNEIRDYLRNAPIDGAITAGRK